MSYDRLVPEFNWTTDRVEQLKEVIPEVFVDGKVSWDALREAFGEYLEPGESGTEHFGLVWPGKRESRRLTTLPSRGALLPLLGDGVNDERSRNLLIEGENLEVLKLLQKAYAGRIKMIYIDPPYNTGNDLIYNDNFADPLGEYLRQTGQADDKGLLTTNTRADGRFHSKWLSMMYSRVKLARNLLTEDGVMFVSIDDSEFANLRILMNEIFGEERFCGVIKRRAARKTAFLSESMSDVCDYVVVYSRGELSEVLSVSAVSDNTRPVFNAGNSVSRRIVRAGTEAKCKDGTYPAGERRVRSLAFTLESDLVVKGGKTVGNLDVSGPWRVNQEIVDKTIFVTRNVGFRRHVLAEEKEKAKVLSDLLDDPTCYNESGTEELERLLGNRGLFDNPKPSALVKYLARAAGVGDGDIVMDFFAGSGATGHAVLDLDHEDGNIRNFILVQLQEQCVVGSVARNAGYETISSITKERIRRVIGELAVKVGDQGPGFRVLRLTKSHFRAWEGYSGDDLKQLQTLFDEVQEPFIAGWTTAGVLCEVMLLEGFPLDSTVSDLSIMTGNKVQVVASDHCAHRLWVCLDKEITSSLVERLEIDEQDVMVCFDAALTDQTKQQLADKCVLKTI